MSIRRPVEFRRSAEVVNITVLAPVNIAIHVVLLSGNRKFAWGLVMTFKRIISVGLLLLSSAACAAEETPADKPKAMDNARLQKIIALVDKNYEGEDGQWVLTLEGVQLRVITDENADRMRIISPILNADSLEKDQLYRLMQANFDSALDARYAIANDMLWGTFIHPLSSLTDDDFVMGIGQIVNVVVSYGSTYSSGVFVFRGGDSEVLQQRLFERLKKIPDSI